MAAEAVGFMSRGGNGGRAAELVTRDFLGGCAADDDARDAAARPHHDAVVSCCCYQLTPALSASSCSVLVLAFERVS